MSNVRGYAIRAATKFIVDNADVRAGVPADFMKKITALEPTLKTADWYPRAQVKGIYEAIAKAAQNETEAYSMLERCGAATAEGATAGYMRLVLKILTPRMFAAKFPEFWARDHQNGQATVTFPGDEKHMRFEIRDVGGFDHIGPISAGVVKFLLGAIGEKGVEVQCAPWSLANPGPGAVTLDIRWQ